MIIINPHGKSREKDRMELICRIIMMLCFDLAALALVLRLAKGGRERGARCLSACLAQMCIRDRC